MLLHRQAAGCGGIGVHDAETVGSILVENIPFGGRRSFLPARLPSRGCGPICGCGRVAAGAIRSVRGAFKQDGFVNRVGVQGAVLIVAGEKGSLCIFAFVFLGHIDACELAVHNLEPVFPLVLDQVLIGAAGCAEILPLRRGDGQGRNLIFLVSSVHRAGNIQPDRRQSALLQEVAGQAFPDLLAADGDIGGQLVDKGAILLQGVVGVVRFAGGLVAFGPGVILAVQIQNIVTIL